MTNIPFSLAIIILLIYSFYFSKFESKWRFSVCFLLTLESVFPSPTVTCLGEEEYQDWGSTSGVLISSSLLLCPYMALLMVVFLKPRSCWQPIRYGVTFKSTLLRKQGNKAAEHRWTFRSQSLKHLWLSAGSDFDQDEEKRRNVLRWYRLFISGVKKNWVDETGTNRPILKGLDFVGLTTQQC